MTLSELSIRRPVMTTLLTATIIAFGIFGFRLLPVSALPKVDFPTIAVTATLPGASADTMAASVAGVIERQLSTIAGISSMSSSSSQGTTGITIQFDLNRNIDAAALDVQTALTIAQRRLPIEMTIPPSFRKVNPGDFPVLFVALSSSTLPLSAVNEFGDITIGQALSQITGVAQVVIYGSQKFAIRVQADPEAAAARGLSLEDIRTAVSRANSSTPVGTLNGPKQDISLQASGQMNKASDYDQIVVAWRNGSPVKLNEVAKIYDAVENDKVATWLNGKRAIVLAIQKQPDANTVAVVDGVRAKLPSLQAQLPPSIEVSVMMDRSVSVREAVADVEETLLIAVVLVIIVIFLFLRSASATFIPALAVPISLFGTCAVMYMLDYSINNMTLLALTLSVGFVVDDAIVMLENIVRHIEHGMKPFDAALKGAREIGFTIISITFSLIAVFIPVLLMGGIVGRVFREFAVTVAVAIIVSGFVSLTLTPMLCARVLKAHDPHKKENIVLRLFERMFAAWLRGYEWALDHVLAHKFLMLMLTIATLGGTVYLYMIVPKGFFPQEDTGFLTGITEAATDTSFEAMTTRQMALAELLKSDPAVDYINSTVGSGGPNPTANYGRLFIALKPQKQREPAPVVIARLRQKATAIPGLQAFFQSIQNLSVGGRPSKSQYQYVLQGSDTETLYRVSPEMRDQIAKVPGLLDVTTDLYIKNPQMTVDIDREKAAVYGITVDQVRNQLYNAFGARQVGTIYMPTNDYQIILEAQPQFRIDPSDISRLYMKTGNNQTIPLSAVARLVPTVGPLQINHQGQQPAVTISFNLQPGYSLGYAVDQITRIEADSKLPVTIATGFSGTAQVFQDSLRGQGVLILAAVFAAFVILGILYESFIHPITIISGLPSAGIGAILTLMLFKMEMSVIAMIGIVMLVGIVKKNAIMMVDFALERRRVGLSAEHAIREAALLRFRPIMMTTFAAIFGTLPIALGAGAGAELRQPLGIAVVGGLCVSQILTLFITPVIYIYLDRIDRKLKRRLNPQEHEAFDEERPRAVAAE
ncbi:efflux RND transporter permease subunit [Tardiphaga sp. vice352]|uniref:efflux RND transporter permease subunit n=1 Tax=unclassified Tardiphaga TaxID=2631404 RepID=UPI001161CBC5|nr:MULTISPECIES: efflux RND transporter permease subunit [unclassified Tardiphaga]MBC7585471.1 efflux RND transporter permease subunit [Tardiphaga sp.]QDM17418.1 efflux RND transporter permease subunit [Tardiphaga sp. vice278]QDM22391.1 efflux RND transporter permease subunit [Tardiphaga sp. vice154]QDM27676.1 efflux RND transporter permease subunit [Tardiphaga sp. vice304]QDM32817.1 efflux RND transporter permease subunit [Tardiphaga sp. vice352]